jgi:hypothetical protein
VPRIDAQRETQLPRPIREVGVALDLWPPRPNQIDATQRLDRTNEHCAWLVLGASDRVEAPVHAINEIHIRDARTTIERFGARGATCCRVTREIMFAEIRFGLDDASGNHAVSAMALQHGAE